MRWTIFPFASLLLLSACEPKPPRVEASETKPPVEINYPVPGDLGAQIVNVVTRDIAAGAEIPWHTHPGVEIAYVESGTLDLMIAGEANRRLRPGDSFMVPRGLVHGGRNAGAAPARLVLTYVVDRDAPLRTLAEPPAP